MRGKENGESGEEEEGEDGGDEDPVGEEAAEGVGSSGATDCNRH